MNMELIWKNIQRHEGVTFRTVRGIGYTYVVYDGYLLVNDDKKRRITKEDIHKALMILNPTPGKLGRAGIWGTSYVYGIITDERIRCG